ncbi:helix-turn-helix domain-containing protein [Pontibaca sp. S1109L]|uniref:Helix-turn-helix domain-containing protein n=2 Tax=Pontibaca salina TaxID=2795731 RepID=A0A934HRE7_9RHOB|nr:helix-turn-helix domain-containing protein [Pontibaca salina]
MKPTEVAALLGVSQRTLSRWHALRVGPARCKVGRRVLYRKSAIDAWLKANETKPVHTFDGGTA